MTCSTSATTLKACESSRFRGALLGITTVSFLVAPLLGAPATAALNVRLDGPKAVPRFDVAEFVLRVEKPAFANPFTDVAITGTFRGPRTDAVVAQGFADAADGSVFRLRFSPALAETEYQYHIRFSSPAGTKIFQGTLRSEASERAGPV